MFKKKLKTILVLIALICLLVPIANIATEPNENEITNEVINDENETEPEKPEVPVEEGYVLSWSYDTIQNGTITVIDADGITCLSNDSSGGSYRIKEGTTVNIKMAPSYGYEFLGDLVDGKDAVTRFLPNSDVCVYRFKMPNRDITLQNNFSQAKLANTNEPEGKSSKKITSLKINEIGSNNVSSGITKVIYGAATPSDEIQNVMDSAASNSGCTVFEYLNIRILNRIRKGGAQSEYWENEMTDLNSPVTVIIGLSTNKSQAPYKVVRYHNGKAEVLDAEYNEEKQTISFQSDKFSYFALASVPPTANNNTNKTSTTTSTTKTTTSSTNTVTNKSTNTTTTNTTDTTSTTNAVVTSNNNPKTGDEIDNYVTSFIISVIIMVAIVLSYKMDG